MYNFDFVYLVIIILFIGYVALGYLSNGINIRNKHVNDLKNINIRMDEQVNAIREIYEKIKKDVLLVKKKEEGLISWGEQLEDMQERYVEHESEYKKNKEKHDADLFNARNKASKFEKRAKEVEKKLADLLIKVS